MVYEGKLCVKGLFFGVLVSRFNENVTGQLVHGAVNTLKRYGAEEEQIDVFKVPGVMELAPLSKRLALLGKYHALVCLGAVIRGGTPHFEYVSASSVRGIMQVGLETMVPILHGILTTNTLEEALERSGGKMGNKGSEVAVAAIEMAQLYKSLGKTPHCGFQS